jgi:hypothetical protein
MVFDWKLRIWRPHKTGWKNPNPQLGPRDERGRFVPRALVQPASGTSTR